MTSATNLTATKVLSFIILSAIGSTPVSLTFKPVSSNVSLIAASVIFSKF